MTVPASELVVLLDEDGNEIGTAPKESVHGPDTALHLAFSCHVVRDDGAVLVTRRALSKRTWPGVWTNSFCGHPAPAEQLVDAVERRARFELGLALTRIEPVLPAFRYRATDANGTVENELCPVYIARAEREPHPNPHEVAEYLWAQPADLRAAATATPWAFSPWLVLQVAQLPLFAGQPTPTPASPA